MNGDFFSSLRVSLRRVKMEGSWVSTNLGLCLAPSLPSCAILGEGLSDSEPGLFHLSNGPQAGPSLTLGSVAGADGTPDERDGRPAAQLGHEYLGTDHLPAGHLPGLGQPPPDQCHSTAIHLGQ